MTNVTNGSIRRTRETSHKNGGQLHLQGPGNILWGRQCSDCALQNESDLDTGKGGRRNRAD